MSDRRRFLDEILGRIQEGIDASLKVLADFPPERVEVAYKLGDDPITAADHAVDEALRTLLPRPGEGWLSEETVDSPDRLACRRVWVVDPLDGTREFVSNIPEWCVSIGFVEDGRPIAGGVVNPSTGEQFIGAVETGLRYNGRPARVSERPTLVGGTVPASRSELRRGEWKAFEQAGFTIRPTGSAAYKMALVAAGLAEASWTLVPKNEWDVAAGTALVLAGGGLVYTKAGRLRRFNQPDPLMTGLIATSSAVAEEVEALLGISPDETARRASAAFGAS